MLNKRKNETGRSVTLSGLLFYASNESKSVFARDLGDCRVNLKNTLCKFLIVLQEIVFLLNKKPYAGKSAAIKLIL